MRRRRRRRRIALPPLHPALRVPAALLVPATPFIAAALTGTSTPQPATIELAGVHVCAGIYRWNVKTFTDPDASLVQSTPTTTTVHELVSKPRPAKSAAKLFQEDGRTRFSPVELTTWRIVATLDRWKVESNDGDIHLVVRDPSTKERMVVEFPDRKCSTGATDAHHAAMTAARAALEQSCSKAKLSKSFNDLGGEATITGVGFFDRPHGESAKNGIELHPALSFASTDCKPKPPSP